MRIIWLFTLLTIAPLPSLAEPLFPNSVVSNDLDFIRLEDPEPESKLTYIERRRAEMPDKRNDSLFADAAFIFQIEYQDATAVPVWLHPDFETEEAARAWAQKVISPLGKLPLALRARLSHVVIHRGNETAFAEEQGRFFVLYSEHMNLRISANDLEETVFHETIHATLEADHATAPAWIEAQKSDGDFITRYAAEHPLQEDLPESALFAWALTQHPGRLGEQIEDRVRETIPHRLRYLQDLFDSFDSADADR